MIGAGEGPDEYEHFLEDLQTVVAERVDELRTRQSAQPPKAFLDQGKVIIDWPEVAGRIIEEFR